MGNRDLLIGCILATVVAGAGVSWAEDKVSFNDEIRPLLSNACYRCHGPDEETRKADVRLDTREGAMEDHDGFRAIVPGDVDESELIYRIESDDPDEVMPPPEKGERFTKEQVDLMKRWIRQGAEYDLHWAYQNPERGTVPKLETETFTVRGAVDAFVLSTMEEVGLKPSDEAEPHILARRVALDLTGLPPTIEEVEAFLTDEKPGAYERLVDRLLAKPAYGEHWARMWLDLARYADSAGYADDPPRTIWAYRDYVICSFNANKPLDQFTIEQLAGDLLENPTEEQLVATAFHRNTQTNSEGGTDDEEFRNAAVVDRVNTTMTTWMGTTMACAQCHTHKYDPLTQEEYFRMFAIFNNTEDSDKKDERPTIRVLGEALRGKRLALEAEIARLEKAMAEPTKEELAGMEAWEDGLKLAEWKPLEVRKLSAASGATLTEEEDGAVVVSGKAAEKDLYVVEGRSALAEVKAVRLEVLADERLEGKGPGRKENFVLSELELEGASGGRPGPRGRYVRVELPGPGKFLHLAEVEVFRGATNLARAGKASQSSTGFGGPASRAIDGNTNGAYDANSTTHTAAGDPAPWWEVDLGRAQELSRIVVWNRLDGTRSRLDGFQLSILDDERNPVWRKSFAKAPERDLAVELGELRGVLFASAFSSFDQGRYEVGRAIDGVAGDEFGWAVAGATGRDHEAVFRLARPLQDTALRFRFHQNHAKHPIGKFRISVTDGEALPPAIGRVLATPVAEREEEGMKALVEFYLASRPRVNAIRETLADRRKELAEMKPVTTVPVMRELAKGRETHIQMRGNYLDRGETVAAGVPEVFGSLPEGVRADRLALARWLVAARNPLTARVLANRFWEKVFEAGLVATSEEFGSQGEAPSHPELLDWLAVELRENGWDMKAFLRMLVTSSTYRQSSHVTPELQERDPANRYLARGPRVRLTAEMVRDQALAVSGLLSAKMYGPPARPPQPKMGLKAAFGGGIDWKTSEGEDRYRRGIYTNWRRSNPYPSMVAFDAPNREVCLVRRDRTNTPLQALVTLNDPVYIEAAQALARRMDECGETAEAIDFAFRTCLSRAASAEEKRRLGAFYDEAMKRYAGDAPLAKKMATDPLGPVEGMTDYQRLAALTVVGNVVLNLDELLMKR